MTECSAKQHFVAWVFALITVCFLGMPFSAVGSEDLPVYRLNLHECIAMALRANEELKAANYDIYGYVARKIEATKRHVPVVKYKYRIAPVPRDLDNPAESFFGGDISVFNSIKIEAGVPITTFGRLETNKELADIGIDASKLKKKQKAEEIVLDIHKLYYGILLARESRSLADRALTAIEGKIGELEKQENTDQLQILKLKAIFYQVEKKLDEANKKETIALAMLKVRTGIEDDADLELKDKLLRRESFDLQPYESLLTQAKQTRPEFTLLKHQVAAKERQLILEKKEYLPQLVFGGFFEYGYSPGITGDEGDNAFNNPFNFTKAGAGLELSGDLDFRKIKSKTEFAKAEYLKAIADKRSNTRLLEVDLKNAYLDLKQKEKLLWRSQNEERSARQIVFLTKSNLDIGLGEKGDYWDAMQSYLLIQAAVYENIFNYNVAVATLKQKMGTLTLNHQVYHH